MVIRTQPWRRWGRLGCEVLLIGVWLWLIWGKLLGVVRVDNDLLAPEVRDGDVVFYERLLAPNLEELVVWPNGELGRWKGDGIIMGRAVLLWRGRGI